MSALLTDQPSTRPDALDARFSTDAEREAAVRRRDSAADGQFVYSVRTTGVYCRPSCAARPARRENLAYHLTPAQAEQAGFRACKRCRPDQPGRPERESALVTEACRAIESADEPPRLGELASAAGLSQFQFHRLFKRATGVTPRAYAEAHRQQRVQQNLETGAGVTETIYATGFNSSGRFYEAAAGMLGMTPSAYRHGGAGEVVRQAVRQCSLGWVLVAATDRGVCAILLGDDPVELREDLRRRFPRAELSDTEPAFEDLVAVVVRLIDDPASGDRLSLPLDIRGTAFQRRVWEALREIPAGQTASYGEVARRLGAPGSARAVAAACAANRLAVAIPCHRIVAASGELTGYRWGIDRKRRLLERERAR